MRKKHSYIYYFTRLMSLCIQFIRRIIFYQKMEGSDSQKRMYSTLKKQKIFNVRKLPYKQFDNQKFLKYNCSPFGKKQPFNEQQINVNHAKNMEYHYQLAIMTSPAYKELHRKYKELKDHNRKEKEDKLKILQEREEELSNYIKERERLQLEREKLLNKRQQLKQYIEQIRYQRFAMEQERSEQYRVMNMEYLKGMLIGMHYQGGVDIDPDNMTYEELLQLEQKIGKVSKGISEDQYNQIHKIKASKEHEQQLCSICYYNIKQEEEINCLPCKHMFHCQCIKEWLLKEKVCPMCKQQISVKREQNQDSHQ